MPQIKEEYIRISQKDFRSVLDRAAFNGFVFGIIFCLILVVGYWSSL